MAFPIMELDNPNVKPKSPAFTPSNKLSYYRLGFIPSGHAQPRYAHNHISDKVQALCK